MVNILRQYGILGTVMPEIAKAIISSCGFFAIGYLSEVTSVRPTFVIFLYVISDLCLEYLQQYGTLRLQ